MDRRKFPLNRLHGLIPLLLVLTGTSCAPAPNVDAQPELANAPATSANPSMSSGHALPRALRMVGKLECKPRTNGVYNCTAPGFDISGSEEACDAQSASFGNVMDERVALVSTISATDGDTTAHASRGQAICIQFTADSTTGGGAWHYVTVIPGSLIPGCKDEAICANDGAVEWTARAPLGTCRIGTDGRYTEACAAGWVRADSVTEFSMGLHGQYAEGAQVDNPGGHGMLDFPVDFKQYGAAPIDGGQCIVGAYQDDLGRQSAAVFAVSSDGRRRWEAKIPRDPDFHQNRATHCACTSDACYVAVATDTQPSQSLSQTLLSIVRISLPTGKLGKTHSVDRIPGGQNAATMWIEDRPDAFAIRGERIELRGLWRAQPEDDARPFHVELPLF